MTKYKRIETKNGRTQYWVDGKMKSVEVIPLPVLDLLEPGVELEIGGEEVSEESPAPAPVAKTDPAMCYFADAQKSHGRFLNGEHLALCETHYKLNVGKLAQAIREKAAT